MDILSSPDYSQSGEQAAILDIAERMGEPGSFLDIGAGEGEKFSNTRCLVDLEWDGVMVEPTPQLFELLVKRYAGNGRIVPLDRVKCVQALVTAERQGLALLHYTPGDFLSTTDISRLTVWPRVPHKAVWLATATVTEILDQFGPFSFVSIDTEGTSIELFAAYRTHEHWGELVGACVEVESLPDIQRVLAIAGDDWEVLAETPNNLVIWRA